MTTTDSLGDSDLANTRIVEIGPAPYIKSILPKQTTYFSTYIESNVNDPQSGNYTVSSGTLATLWRLIHSADTYLIVCQPTFFSPWHWQWLVRVLFHRRIFSGHLSYVSALGPQFLRANTRAPVAILDLEDIPLINHNNFFLLKQSDVYFKRELPVDRWRLFMKTGHRDLPTARFRRQQPYADWIKKIRPISIGLPLSNMNFLPKASMGKTVDVFFSGRVEQSSSIRTCGMEELLALKKSGLAVDIPDRPLPPAEYYQRCARAHITWSPEGYGWDCFRHYEAPACWSVPVINYPTIERYSPFVAGEHAFFYSPEPGGLTGAIQAALADKPNLARMAEAGRRHVLAHHSPASIARHVVETTLGLRAS